MNVCVFKLIGRNLYTRLSLIISWLFQFKVIKHSVIKINHRPAWFVHSLILTLNIQIAHLIIR